MRGVDEPYGPQMMGEDEYTIWSMSYEWEPEGDPNGKAFNFERANHFGTYKTLLEAQAALAKLTIHDENWYQGKPGYDLFYWIWRETPMMQKHCINENWEDTKQLTDGR